MKDKTTVSWQDVVTKFRYSYLRRLAIFYHLYELSAKMERLIAEDKCPFNEKEFMKELADLYLLLQMHYEYDSNFAELVKLRQERFIEKLKQEIEKEVGSIKNKWA